MNTFKMRAESPIDFFNAWQNVAMATYTVTGGNLMGMGDCEIVFESEWSLARIIDALDGVQDGHVMRETVQYIAEYTGERE